MKQRILIVEDNILLSRVIGEWLAKCGYETASVMDEPSARRMLADGEFDLVLSDVRLPNCWHFSPACGMTAEPDRYLPSASGI